MALFLLLLLSQFASPSTADPLYYICGRDKFISNHTYDLNLNNLFYTLSSNATDFATSATGEVPDRVYGLVLCRGDTGIAYCLFCISAAISEIRQICPINKDATIWYDYCQLSYSHLNFLYSSNVTTSVQAFLANDKNVSAAQLQRFEILINELMRNLTNLAVRNTSRFYATGEAPFTAADIMYGTVQCALDLTANDCRTCLQQTVNYSKNYLKGARGGRTLGIWCNTRYEFAKFYDGTSMLQLSSNQPHSSTSPTNISMQNGTHPPANLSHGGEFHIEEISNVECLLFDLSTLQVATANFSEHNKLGEGGFGSVYLGLLPDGREIAVKRLST